MLACCVNQIQDVDYMLETKTITELRGILAAMGGDMQFSDTKKVLLQKIETKRHSINSDTAVQPIYTSPPDDQRLRIVPPSKNMAAEALTEALQPFIDRGLRLECTDTEWTMSCGKKADSGNLRMPLRVVVGCAKEVMR